MPELAVMDLGRQLCVKMKKQRKAEMTIPTAMKGLEIHFYLADTHQLEFFKACYTAEDLCVEAAKRCRISPLCHNLFALYEESQDLWYAPNHVFKVTDETSIKLHYRMRFYFTNWHGTSEIESPVWRHTLSKQKSVLNSQKTTEGTPLLDAASLDYLFAQGQYDFLRGLSPVRPTQTDEEHHEIENECLGMAVLAITHHAKSNNLPLSGAGAETSYKRFIPDSLNRTIKQRNFLTRIRISNVFKNFLNEFNRKTIQDSNIGLYDLKVKYLSTLETLTQGVGREIFKPKNLKVTGESEGSPAQMLPLGDNGMGYEVQVYGTTGISWRRKPAPNQLILKDKPKSKKIKGDKQWNDKKKDSGWTLFSDFHEITHIVIKDCCVTIYRQDNKTMVLLSYH